MKPKKPAVVSKTARKEKTVKLRPAEYIDWQSLAKNLQEALMREMKETEKLEQSLESARNYSMGQSHIISYLESRYEQVLIDLNESIEINEAMRKEDGDD